MFESQPRRSARRRLAHLLCAALLGAALLGIGAVSGLAAEPTIQASGNSLSNYAWSPSTAEVAHDESVKFKNSTGVPHALAWESGNPETPTCTGTPSAGQGEWEGSCTFAQAGTYKFYCPVHPAQMKGTITVSGPASPVVSTAAASAVGETGATLNGSVNPSGQSTTYHFDYGATGSYGQETPEEAAGEGTTAASKSAVVSGLTPATTYHFRIVAKSAAGTTLGADRTFSTTGPPSPTTQAATNVGGTGATLGGTVNPHGLATNYFFEYGTTAAYGQETGETSAGSGTTEVSASATLSGLSPETIYHFRLVAKSSAGKVVGADKAFTTLGAPLATTGAAAAIGQTGATLQGVVNPQGQATTYVFRFGTTTAYGQETAQAPAGSGLANVAATATLSGLSPATVYHFQLVAKNASGTTPGADQSFTTTAAVPVIETPPAPQPPASPSAIQPPPLVPAPPPAPARVPVDTKITLKPRPRTKDRTPTLKFTATAAGATFRCSVDRKPFKSCRSPFTTPSLKPGRHTVRVAASAGGLTDPTPATCKFKVTAKRKSAKRSRRHR
jgi:plastocyanin